MPIFSTDAGVSTHYFLEFILGYELNDILQKKKKSLMGLSFTNLITKYPTQKNNLDCSKKNQIKRQNINESQYLLYAVLNSLHFFVL